MGTECSLPDSQQHASCPHPQPDQSIPHTPSYFLKILFNITLPPVPISSLRSFYQDFPLQHNTCASPVLHACQIPPPPSPHTTLSSIFDHPDNICWEQIMKPLNMQPSPLPRYHVPVGLKYLPQHSTDKYPQAINQGLFLLSVKL